MARFKWKKKAKFGPIQLNTTNGRVTSWSIKLGRLSWNSRTRKWHFDTPGPGSVEWGGKDKKKH